MTASKLAGGNVLGVSSPAMNSIARPARSASSRACPIEAGLMSIPVTCAPRAARKAAVTPDPQAKSRTRRPRTGSIASSIAIVLGSGPAWYSLTQYSRSGTCSSQNTCSRAPTSLISLTTAPSRLPWQHRHHRRHARRCPWRQSIPVLPGLSSARVEREAPAQRAGRGACARGARAPRQRCALGPRPPDLRASEAVYNPALAQHAAGCAADRFEADDRARSQRHPHSPQLAGPRLLARGRTAMSDRAASPTRDRAAGRPGRAPVS